MARLLRSPPPSWGGDTERIQVLEQTLSTAPTLPPIHMNKCQANCGLADCGRLRCAAHVRCRERTCFSAAAVGGVGELCVSLAGRCAGVGRVWDHFRFYLKYSTERFKLFRP